MRKAQAFLFLCCLLFFSGITVYAQEEESDEESEEEIPFDEYEGVTPSLYSSGEQMFSFTLGALFPLFYTNSDGIAPNGTNVNVGGGGYLSYNYFLGPRFFVGGEAGGMFAGTIGENMLYIVPFGVRGGYQFAFSIKNARFEIPVSLTVGGVTQKYLETDYFGLFLKPVVAGFFRLNPDWSFGLNVGWLIIPQWTKEPRKNMTGHFLEVSLSARFHF
ncbi:MAG: hypothetical protein LBL45_06730 [Treponema sp.]|jgi:hypothetical protein|nr:hypothetical protein [Treponema sp.]